MDRIRFFEEWSREAAWVYGLILGDGHVMCNAHGGRIMFCGNRDTVFKFGALMEVPTTRPVFKRGVWHSWFDDKALALWFRKRGVNAKKSQTLPWPRDIPKAVRWDFVRGLVDTDGTLVFHDTKKWSGKGRLKFGLGFGSATKSFVEAFAKFVGSDRAIVESTKLMPSGIKHYFQIHMSVSKSLEVCRQVYDCALHMRNEERYQRWMRGEALAAEYGKGCQTIVNAQGELCGKPIHTGEVCTGCMWAAKTAGRICEGCGKCPAVRGWFCLACEARSYRLMKNPNLKTRKRRT